jgi:mRNA interferase MazF
MFLKNFTNWFTLKPKLEDKIPKILVKERDIIWCHFGENVGCEESGKGEMFLRPVLIIRKFNADLFLVVPLTSKVKDNQYYVKYTIHNQEYCAMISQITTVDRKRFRNKIYQIDIIDYNTIVSKIRDLLIFK